MPRPAQGSKLIAALLALLLAACGPTPAPTPQSLGNGLVRHFPQSTAASVNDPTKIVLGTHCGIEQTLIDFAGRLWEPVGLPRGNGGVIGPPRLVNDPRDEGTITLLREGAAIYESELGKTILLRPAPGHRDLMVCY